MYKTEFFKNTPTNYLKMDYQTFDQDINGWRSLAQENKFEEAANIIIHYLEEKKGQLAEHEVCNLYFHAGQMFAFNNMYEKAIGCFEIAFLSKEHPDAPVRWNAYVKGTIAFLKKDSKTLSGCIDEVSRGKQIYGIIPNLDYLKNLAQYLNLPYAETYRMSTSNIRGKNCN